MLHIPVTATLMGKGAFPEIDPLYLGVPGMHGTAYANLALDQADLIICIGARFDDRVTGDVSRFAPNARIIHVDVDPAEIGKVVNADVPMVGDAKHVLGAIAARNCRTRRRPVPDFSRLARQIEAWKAQYPMKWSDDGSHRMRRAMRRLSRTSPTALRLARCATACTAPSNRRR